MKNDGKLSEIKSQHGKVGAAKSGATYVSPSLWTAAHPIYAQLEDLGSRRYLQLVCEVRVRPGTYVEQDNTINAKLWDPWVLLDPNYPHNRTVECATGEQPRSQRGAPNTPLTLTHP